MNLCGVNLSGREALAQLALHYRLQCLVPERLLLCFSLILTWWLLGPGAGPDHYRTYPMAQDAVRHSSASVDTPLSRSTGPNGSSDMSYVSTASVDSGPDEMAEIPETGRSHQALTSRRGGQESDYAGVFQVMVSCL